MRTVQRRTPGFAAAVVAALAMIGALPPTNAVAQNLTGAGATFPYPVYSKWFDAYRQKTGVAINYQSIGSGAGIQQVKAGTVDFGASDAPLSNDRLRELPRPVVHFPMVAGAVVLAYNLPGFKARLRLTPEILAGIYLGRIVAWNDKRVAAANPGAALPAAPILAVHRSDGSGTTSIFTSYLAAVNGEWRELVGANTSVSWPGGVGGKGNDGVAGLVRQTPGAIGYVELAFARQNRLATALLRNRAGHFVEPTLISTTAAVAGAAAALARDPRTSIVNSPAPQAWPISGLTYLLVYRDQKDPVKGRALAEFIRWSMRDGQAMVEALDYARLPDHVVGLNEANTLTLTSGGRPLLHAR